MPDTTNRVTNFVENTDDGHVHGNFAAYNGHGAHFNEQSRFTIEGVSIQSNNVGNLDSDFNYQHFGSHSRSSYEDGSGFQQHFNVNDKVMNIVSIIHLPEGGADVSHLHIHQEDNIF